MTLKYVDHDFEDCPEGQSTGLLEQPDDEIMASFGPMASFEDDYPSLMVPRSKRLEMAREKWARQKGTVRNIWAQLRTSACVGFGAAQCLETTCTRRHGNKNNVGLSGMFVYNHIGNTLMSGAYIPDGMRHLVDVGTIPIANSENNERFDTTWPNDKTGYYKRVPSNIHKGIQWKVAKFAVARGKDAIESALLNDLCGIVGRSRHCVPYCGLCPDGNKLYAGYANSWGESWGDNGWGYDSTRVYDGLSLYLILEVAVPSFLEIL